MSIPKQKRDKSRGRRKQSEYIRRQQEQLIARINIVKCYQCGEEKLSHTICGICGAYKPAKAAKTPKASKKKETPAA